MHLRGVCRRNDVGARVWRSLLANLKRRVVFDTLALRSRSCLYIIPATHPFSSLRPGSGRDWNSTHAAVERAVNQSELLVLLDGVMARRPVEVSVGMGGFGERKVRRQAWGEKTRLDSKRRAPKLEA